MSASLIIIPTYNEKENVERLLRKIMTFDREFNVLVIDDGSPDGTADIVKNIMKEFPERIHIQERSGKLGLGTAYIHGFKWALAREYKYIFEMDADFSHDPNDVIRLHKAAVEGAELVIGSRYVNGVNVVNWPMGRVLMSYYASAYVRFITRMRIHDSTAGFICYRREVLETIELDEIRFKGYAFQIEMKFKAWKYGFKIVEVPIIFRDRSEGTSKMSSHIFTEAMFGVIWMRINSWFKSYKRSAKTK